MKRKRTRGNLSPKDKKKIEWCRKLQLLAPFILGGKQPATIKFEFKTGGIAINFQAPSDIKLTRIPVPITEHYDIVDHSEFILEQAIEHDYSSLLIVFDFANDSVLLEDKIATSLAE